MGQSWDLVKHGLSFPHFPFSVPCVFWIGGGEDGGSGEETIAALVSPGNNPQLWLQLLHLGTQDFFWILETLNTLIHCCCLHLVVNSQASCLWSILTSCVSCWKCQVHPYWEGERQRKHLWSGVFCCPYWICCLSLSKSSLLISMKTISTQHNDTSFVLGA